VHRVAGEHHAERAEQGERAEDPERDGLARADDVARKGAENDPVGEQVK
jgi:hypothetical protein